MHIVCMYVQIPNADNCNDLLCSNYKYNYYELNKYLYKYHRY